MGETEELWMSAESQENAIIACAVLSIIFGIYNVWQVLRIKV